MEYNEMSDTALVTELVKIKDKIKEMKAKENAIAAELQLRASQEMDKKGIKFKRFKSSKGSATVSNKNTMSLISPLALKRVVGEELFESEVTETKETNYKLSTTLETALKAIAMEDYEFDLTLDKVYDALGADDDQRKVLNKKLRGDYAKDYEILTAMFGKSDYDTEVYCIHKIKNAELIKILFPDKSIEEITEIAKYVIVNSTLTLTTIR